MSALSAPGFIRTDHGVDPSCPGAPRRILVAHVERVNADVAPA